MRGVSRVGRAELGEGRGRTFITSKKAMMVDRVVRSIGLMRPDFDSSIVVWNLRSTIVMLRFQRSSIDTAIATVN